MSRPEAIRADAWQWRKLWNETRGSLRLRTILRQSRDKLRDKLSGDKADPTSVVVEHALP
jgi:hypothetical protein